jgi:hypothetical protein
MAGPILYSTNPWFAFDVTMRHRGGVFFAWVCECFDASYAAPGSAAALIAPSSNPRKIYRDLQEDCDQEDKHSDTIRRYRKTFVRLAKDWLTNGSIGRDAHDEIVASVRAPSWQIWRPVLYVIPREPIEAAGRMRSVARSDRAGYGPEQQVTDLKRHEFDMIELRPR